MFLRGDGVGCHGFAGLGEDSVAGGGIMLRHGKEWLNNLSAPDLGP